MRYSEVGKYGIKRLRKEKFKKIGYAISCIVLGALGAVFIIYGLPYLMEFYR